VNILGMGPLELVVIFGLALIVFGPGKLPELARQLGKTISDFRRITSEVSGDLQRGLMVDDQQSRQAPPVAQPAPPAPPPPTATSSTPTAPNPALSSRRGAGDDDALRPPY
jgi:TatA/E family protein of Tat protein translocase